MILVLVHSDLKTIVTNIEFISVFLGNIDVNGYLFCVYTNFEVAYKYLSDLEPGSSLFTTYVSKDDVLPPQLKGRLSQEEYKGILKPIHELTDASEIEIRGLGAAKGAMLGASAVAPLALIVGVATLGLGAPISLFILGAGAGVGTGLGAALPVTLKKNLENLESYVNTVNESLLRKRGVVLISPLASNSVSPLDLPKVSVDKMRSLTWVIKSDPESK